jgi:hypothetical protein
MFDILWGLKTVALFDVWSIEHLLTGLSVGSAVKKRNQNIIAKLFQKKDHGIHSLHFDVVGVLFIAYLWETLEHYLEIGLAGPRVEYWFQGVEFFGNRFITDPLIIVVGYYVAKKYPHLVVPARFLSVLWLVVHVFVFPHSMYLQELFIK